MSRIALKQRADVYLPDGSTRKYSTTPVKTGLQVRMWHYQRVPPQMGMQRRDMTDLVKLHSEPDYEVPENSRLLIDGEWWSFENGTVQVLRGRSGLVHRRICDLRKVKGT